MGKAYKIRIDPCTKSNLNYIHNFYRFCDMDDHDLVELLKIINKIKELLFNIDESNYLMSLYHKLSIIYPSKSENGIYYKIIDKIHSETEGLEKYGKCIPSHYTIKMKMFQCLYIAMTEIIMDIFKICDEYKKDDKIIKSKLYIYDINKILCLHEDYKSIYNLYVMNKI
jgi:hypothetical protein